MRDSFPLPTADAGRRRIRRPPHAEGLARVEKKTCRFGMRQFFSCQIKKEAAPTASIRTAFTPRM
jgi:hypothetical protein